MSKQFDLFMTTRDLYLNHAGTSWPKPKVVLDAVNESMSLAPTKWAQRFAEAHHGIAEFFGVNQPDQILLTPGCTSAIAVGLGDALIPRGKRVLTSRWEHHSLHRPLIKLAATGVAVGYIPPVDCGDADGYPSSIDLDWLENELSNNDVGLVAITAACNVTGELLPFEDVIRLAHQYDSLVMIDAAQIVGWLKLDLHQLGADMVAFGGHKGLQAPWGIGGLYLSENARMQCVSAKCELPTQSTMRIETAPRPGYCDVGSVDQAALAGLHTAVKYLGQSDMESNLAKARRQIQRIRNSLSKVDSIDLIEFGESGMPTIGVAIGGLTSAQLARHLVNYRLTVGSGIHCAPLAHETLGTQQTGLIRLSVGVGQSEDEIDETIERLDEAFYDKKLQDLRDSLD